MNSKGQLKPPPEDFIQPLLGLRDHYARLVKEYETLYQTARSQLAHVEALLANSNDVNGLNGHNAVTLLNATPVSVTEASLTTEEISSGGDSFPKSLAAGNQAIEDNNHEQTDKQERVTAKESSQDLNVLPSESRAVTTVQKSNKSKQLVPDIPMVSEYGSLTRMQAIEKLLQEHIGAVCHIDFIVRSLYGDLEPNLFKVVKGRVQSSLTHGKEKTYWSAVPEEPGCYTFDLEKLPLKKGKAKSKAKQKKRKPFVLPKTRRIPMLRAYEGKFLIDAISDFLEENQGTIFSVADIISGLYGELDAQQLREIKSAVLNELSRGYRIGRFSRVPKKIGYYTWDMDAANEKAVK